MGINADRILDDIEAIASFNESSPGIGYSRPTFSKAWGAARDYVIERAAAVGCSHRIDPAGNVLIRPGSVGPNEKCWLSGSHIDSVPTGGKYDGVMGIVVPLEVLRSGPVPLELVMWAEEEGSTFGLGMIGSRLAVGVETPESVAGFKNRAGQNFIEAGKGFGVRPLALMKYPFRAANYHGLIEVHAEQGPAMWAENIRLAAVTAIAGRVQFKVRLLGQANHAGSTPMNYRRDALVAAAKVVLGVEQIANDIGEGVVATVGRLDCEPNAINVIPGIVRLTIDLRSGSAAALSRSKHLVNELVKKSGLEYDCVVTEDQPVMSLDPAVVQRLMDAGVTHRTVSGALHDAAILAPLLPAAMLFVASKDGISHNPAEVSRIEDIAAAAEILRKVVTE